MRVLESRLRRLEQATTDTATLLLFVPRGTPTAAQQIEVERATQAGRVVILISWNDADV